MGPLVLVGNQSRRKKIKTGFTLLKKWLCHILLMEEGLSKYILSNIMVNYYLDIFFYTK